MQAVDLHDLLEVTAAGTTRLTASGMPVSEGADNLVLRAHAAVEAAAGRALPTHLHLHKRIPPGSGMGGASSDAATALRALKAVHALDVDLAALAVGLGADVPFFMHGGRVRAQGRGERLTPVPRVATEPAWFAVAWPGVELSTAAVYLAWDAVNGEGPNQLTRAAEHVDERVREFAQQLGPGWQMTGSGSAFFKVCAGEEEAGRAVSGLSCWTAVTRSVGPWA